MTTTRVQTQRELDAHEIAIYTSNAYMADTYGEAEWLACTRWLLEQGLSTVETILYLRSKHMRWADDTHGRGTGRGHKANLAALREYEIRGTLQGHVEGLRTEEGL